MHSSMAGNRTGAEGPGDISGMEFSVGESASLLLSTYPILLRFRRMVLRRGLVPQPGCKHSRRSLLAVILLDDLN